MSASSAIAAGREAAEREFIDTFTAYEPDGTTTDANGFKQPGFTDRGATPGKVQADTRQGDTADRFVTVGDAERPVHSGGLHLPIGAPIPAVGWEYECTALGPLSDPSLLGRRWRVVSVPAKTYATARRLDVVEVS